MGGDLLSKKGWHVGLLVNQRKVWEAEQQTLAERKKIEQVRREREEERQMEEIARLAEENGGQKRQQRVDWMYTGATAGAAGTSEEQEAYLLGTRRVDNLLKREDSKELEKKEAVQADPVRDIALKVRMDPLLLIEKQKQDALEKAMAVEANMERRKKRRRDRDDRESRHSKHRERRRRSRSRERRRSSSREDKRHRRRSRSRDEHRERRRSRSRETRDRRGDDRRSSHQHRSPDSRSRSPPRRHSHGDRYDDTKRESRNQSYRRRSPPRFEKREPPRRENRAEPRDGEEKDDDRAARLAAMQADASNLEADRVKRLTELEKREAAEREAEDRKRSRNPDFKSKLYRQTAEVGLADRLKGSRGLLST
jgi:hypothetical protein